MTGEERSFKRVVGSLAIELGIYGFLLVLYFLLVLRFLNQPLTHLFHANLIVYAPVALILIVVQGLLLSAFTTFLIKLFSPKKSE
ncbi:MAG: hypothetical protein JXJ17_04025 [Anaerolineae bacterium]|nr:hypothetical protein [Anaerolineae bacterium]